MVRVVVEFKNRRLSTGWKKTRFGCPLIGPETAVGI
jgi:hypothetical protein